MPRLSYPGGRKAAANVKVPDETLHEGQTNPEMVSGAEGNGLDQQVVQEDPTAALQAEIATLKKANTNYASQIEAERQRAEQASRQMQERDAEVVKLKEQTVNSQAEAIDAAISAATAEAESAQRDIESAMSLGDGKGQAEAYRKLARAESRILQLENGKDALERQIKEQPKPVERTQNTGDALDNTTLPPLAKQWLRSHPEYLSDARKNAKIQNLHWDVVEEGHAPYSEGYFEVMEQRLGMRPVPKKEVEVEDEPVNARAVYSAPPTRDVPTSEGKRSGTTLTLTAAQKEAAKISGITEAEYVKNLLKLREEKANGNYGGAP